MKTIVKIEIAILILLLLTVAGLALTDGNLLFDPVIAEHDPVPVPTESTAPTDTQTIPTIHMSFTPPVLSRTITAAKYFAYDIREEVYLVKKGDGAEKLYPASITKLLTAYVALQYLQPEDTLVVGDALSLVQEGSSIAGLAKGDRLTTAQLVAAMLLPSGNDAAQTVAVAAGRAMTGNDSLSCTDAVDVFVDEMNRQAKEIGMLNSHFVNPDGYHNDNHYTTMDDLVVLCQKVLANSMILNCTSQTQYTVELPGRTLEWKNSNHLLDETLETYLPNAIGLKTGYTGKAGNCLVSALFMEDRIWLIGVFGCPEQTEDRYLDTIAIYEALL